MAIGNGINQTYNYTDSTGKKYTIKPASAGGFMNAYSRYETDRKAQMDNTTAQLDKTLALNNATTNSNYDNSARQAYTDYMRKQKALPSQLQSLGVRGGATESGLLNLYNNYGISHAANEQQRNADLTTNQNNRDDAYNTAYQAYLSDLNEQKQKAISNQINEYNNEITRFSSTVAQYPSTPDGIKKYQEWIVNMAKSKDPLKDIKVAIIRQQMATAQAALAEQQKASSSGGRGGRSYGRRSGYGSGSGSSSELTPQQSKTAQAYGIAAAANMMTRLAADGLSKATKGISAKNTVKQSLKNRKQTRPGGYAQ